MSRTMGPAEATAADHGPPDPPPPSPASLRRRTSLEEDYFYRQVMTVNKKPTEPPPSYDSAMKKSRRLERQYQQALAEEMEQVEAALAAREDAAAHAKTAKEAETADRAEKEKADGVPGKSKWLSRAGRKGKEAAGSHQNNMHNHRICSHPGCGGHGDEEKLPSYSCDINLEGLFQRKLEIENTIKRAEDRRWAPVIVELRGTALSVYGSRKDRRWSSWTARGGPGVSPDNPPWLRKGRLEKRYSLAYADVGIASDYLKRRYVLRIRAETDQFLLSCIELETMVRWLDALFASLSISTPLDERDFPRDQSIPRLQRIRWYHGRDRDAQAQQDSEREMQQALVGELQMPQNPLTYGADSNAPLAQSSALQQQQQQQSVRSARSVRWGSVSSQGSMPRPLAGGLDQGLLSQQTTLSTEGRISTGTSLEAGPSWAARLDGDPDRAGERDEEREGQGDQERERELGRDDPLLPSLAARLSRTIYPHDAVNSTTGKWQPTHRWTRTHDLVYAKLCYATLQFRSPRKSNYIIMRGKQWFVDWTTGNMFRVSPPRYGEVELFGPWQVLRTENPRI